MIFHSDSEIIYCIFTKIHPNNTGPKFCVQSSRGWFWTPSPFSCNRVCEKRLPIVYTSRLKAFLYGVMLCVGSATGHRSPLPIDQCTLGNWALCFESKSPVTVKTLCLYSTYIKTFSDLCKVGPLVKRYLDAYQCLRAGRNILCFFTPFRCRDVGLCLHFHCCFVSLDLCSFVVFFFCIKLKSETQNIYNFCMEKKKECKTPKKWENGNYFLLCWQRSGVRKKKRKCYKKYCHFFICS